MKAEYSSGALPSGTSVGSVKDVVITSGTDAANIASALSKIGYANLSINDIQLLDTNGSPITNLSGNVTVKIKIPTGYTNDTLKVYWYDPSTSKLTDMNATAQNGYLVFNTNHFSYYVVAKAANPKTGDTGTMAMTYYELIAIGALITVFLLTKFHKAKVMK
jgi:hypothetical protein